jgi:hypothetical protein
MALSSKTVAAEYICDRDGEEAEPEGEQDQVQHWSFLAINDRMLRRRLSGTADRIDTPQYGQNGVLCARWILVQLGIRNREGGWRDLIKIP